MRAIDTAQLAATEARRATLTMYSPLSAILHGPPATVPLDYTIRETLETMDRMQVGSILVTDPERQVPLGIFTLADLVRRVTLPGGDLQQPIAAAMTSGLITLTPQATAHQAALLMARSGVHRVVVVDGRGWAVGVVSQGDLFGMRRVGLQAVSDQIQSAGDLEGLRSAALAIQRLAIGLLAEGVAAETLSHFISTLNDLLTIRIIELTVDEFDLPTVPMCWIALGSEGRLEQTFSTDQDNGVIFEADDREAKHVRRALLPFAQAVNQRLDACGFPLCRGNIMASNPQWCLRLDEWRRTFSRWIDEAKPQDLLNAAIFFDFRPVYGNAVLAERLRDWLLATIAKRPLFLRFMAENALKCQPPLGTIRDFVYDGSKEFPHSLDLKTYGARLFTDAARIVALSGGVPHTSTAQRLRSAADVGSFGTNSLAAILDSFYFIQRLRLRNQCDPRRRRGWVNRVDPRELNELERQVLKEAFRQARKLQECLALKYGVGPWQ